MTMTMDATVDGGRAARLKAATTETHARLDARIMAAKPFASRDSYQRFVEVQYRFMAAMEPLYHDGRLQALMPGLAELSRAGAARQDLVDLGRPVPGVEPASIAYPEALGWLYVSEGSNLGAAFLIKEAAALGLDAGFGARHLAGSPDGRGLAWRRFKQALDAVPLAPEDESRAVAGAVAAFEHVNVLIGELME